MLPGGPALGLKLPANFSTALLQHHEPWLPGEGVTACTRLEPDLTAPVALGDFCWVTASCAASVPRLGPAAATEPPLRAACGEGAALRRLQIAEGPIADSEAGKKMSEVMTTGCGRHYSEKVRAALAALNQAVAPTGTNQEEGAVRSVSALESKEAAFLLGPHIKDLQMLVAGLCLCTLSTERHRKSRTDLKV